MYKIASLFVVLGGIMFSPDLGAQTPPEDPDRIVVIFTQIDNLHPSSTPKSPSSIQLEAFYDIINTEIVIMANNAGRYISASIENVITGEQSSLSISGSGVNYIPISGASGYWTVTLVLENGAIYYGAFIL